eukprot:1934360-Amphidinium_carterae.1
MIAFTSIREFPGGNEELLKCSSYCGKKKTKSEFAAKQTICKACRAAIQALERHQHMHLLARALFIHEGLQSSPLLQQMPVSCDGCEPATGRMVPGCQTKSEKGLDCPLQSV